MAISTDLVTFEDLTVSMQRVKTEIDNATIESEITQIENQAIVSFTDGVKDYPVEDLDVDLPVKQDLHGYANPWPAGGNINKWDPDTENVGKKIGSSGELVDSTNVNTSDYIPILPNTEYYLLNVVPAANAYACAFYDADKTWISNATVSGTAGSPTSGVKTSPANAYYMRCARYNTVSVNSALNYPSSVTTWTPYSNICPIYPYTEVEVTRTGKNLLDPNYFSGYASYTVNANKTVTVTSSDPRAWNSVPSINLKAGTYTLHFEGYTSGTYQFVTSEHNYPAANYNAASTFTLAADGTLQIKFGTGGASFPQTVKIQLEKGSTATAYESYQGQNYLVNIGINQWDEEWEVGTIDNSGQSEAGTTTIRTKNYITVIGGTSYAFHAPQNGVFFFYDADKTFISSEASAATFTTPANAAYMKFRMASDYGTDYGFDISVNFPSRFTDYYQYTGNEVYAGTLDVTTGVLTATHAQVDLGDETYTLNSGSTFYTSIAGKAFGLNNYACSAYALTSLDISNMPNGSTEGRTNNARVYFRNDDYTDPTAFKSAMAGVKLVYELASPITISLTPQQIATLRGANTIFADAGNILNIEYRNAGLLNTDYIEQIALDIDSNNDDITATNEDTQAIIDIFN